MAGKKNDGARSNSPGKKARRARSIIRIPAKKIRRILRREGLAKAQEWATARLATGVVNRITKESWWSTWESRKLGPGRRAGRRAPVLRMQQEGV